MIFNHKTDLTEVLLPSLVQRRLFLSLPWLLSYGVRTVLQWLFISIYLTPQFQMQCLRKSMIPLGRTKVPVCHRSPVQVPLGRTKVPVCHRSPVQVGCMRQVLGAGALGRWEGCSGWETHVNPWLIHVNVWQKPLQYCKVISIQLIKIN